MGSTGTLSAAVAAATLVSSGWVAAGDHASAMPAELEMLFEAPPPAPAPKPAPREPSFRRRLRPPRVG